MAMVAASGALITLAMAVALTILASGTSTTLATVVVLIIVVEMVEVALTTSINFIGFSGEPCTRAWFQRAEATNQCNVISYT